MNEQLLKMSGADVLSSRKKLKKPYAPWPPPPPLVQHHFWRENLVAVIILQGVEQECCSGGNSSSSVIIKCSSFCNREGGQPSSIKITLLTLLLKKYN